MYTENTHYISYGLGYKLEDYTENLDKWGIKYRIIKGENLDYEDNVVVKVEPNHCKIDKNTVVTFTVSDNTYNMDVIADIEYLLGLADIDISKYSIKYDYESGRYVRDKVNLILKINGNTIYNGQTEMLDINNAKSLGKISGKTSDKYNIEIYIENVKITKQINYNIRCDNQEQRLEIYAGGDIGAG